MLSSIETTSNATTLIVDRHITANAGDQLALRYGEKRYSYNDLAALINRAGNMMRRFGAGSGDKISGSRQPFPLPGRKRVGSNEDRRGRGPSTQGRRQVRCQQHPFWNAPEVGDRRRCASIDICRMGWRAAAGRRRGQPPHRSFLAEMRERPPRSGEQLLTAMHRLSRSRMATSSAG